MRKNKEGYTSLGLKRCVSASGYIRIYMPKHPRATKDGRVLEHIEVWERVNKARLLSWGRVHHKNHIKTDNRPENLEGMTVRQHQRLHHVGAKRSAETCEKLRARMKGTTQSIESNMKRSKTLKGRHFTDEHRRKIGEANKRRMIHKLFTYLFGFAD